MWHTQKEFSPKLGKFTVTGIREIFELAKKFPGVTNLAIGDVDFDTPQHIKDAAIRALEEGFTHYTPTPGIPELREALAKKLLTENGVSVDPEGEVMVTVGATQAILLALQVIIREGEEVLILSPSFPAFSPTVYIAGGEPVEVRTTIENRFRPRLEELEAAVTGKTKAVIINSPCNPTGAVLSEKDLEEIADFAVEHNLFVLSDETYEKLVYEGAHVSMASLEGMKDRTIAVYSLSKSYAMTGWRVGYAAAPTPIIAEMIKLQVYNCTCPPSFTQRAALEAIEGPQDFVAKIRAAYMERLDLAYGMLKSINGIRVMKPQGAIYIFPKLEDYRMSSRQLARFLLDEAGVAVVPGSAFGRYGEGCLRITCSAPIGTLKEALERIKAALRKIRS